MTFTPGRRSLLGAAALAVPTLALASCGSDEAERNADGKIELTMAGWSIDTTPEFEVIVDGFEASNPDVKVVLKEYSADDYDTQLTTDLSANSAPDVFPLKNLENYFYYQSNGALADVSDLGDPLREERSEEHTSELQSRGHLVCRLLLEKKNNSYKNDTVSRSRS